MDQEQINSTVHFATGLAVLGFISGMVSGIARMMTSSSKKPTYLPKIEKRKTTVTCPICGKVIEIAEYDSISRSEALKRHLEQARCELLASTAVPEHHSMWMTPEQRKECEKEAGAIACRWAEEFVAPGDFESAKKAARVFYDKMREAIGIA